MKKLTTNNVIYILAPLVITGAISVDIYIPALDTIKEVFVASTWKLQLTLSIFAFGFGLGQIIYGSISDKHGRRVVALYSMGLYFIGSLFCSLSTSINLLIISRVIQALGACGCMVSAIAIIRDISTEDTRTKLYGRINGIIGAAPILAPWLGANLEIIFNSWRASFIFLSLLSGIAIFIVYARIYDTRSKETQAESFATSNWQILQNPIFIKYVITAILAISGLFLYCSIAPYMLIGRFGLSKLQFGYIFGFNGLVWVVMSFFSSKITKKHTVHHTVFYGILVILCLSIVMVFLEYINMMNLLLYVIMTVCISLIIGVILGPSVSGGMTPFKHCSGKAAALFGCLQYFIPGVIGLMVIRGNIYNSLPYSITMILLSLFTIVFFAISKKKNYQEQGI